MLLIAEVLVGNFDVNLPKNIAGSSENTSVGWIHSSPLSVRRSPSCHVAVSANWRVDGAWQADWLNIVIEKDGLKGVKNTQHGKGQLFGHSC